MDMLQSRRESLLPDSSEASLALPMSGMDHLISCLEDHVMKTINAEHKDCQSFFLDRELLKTGTGLSSRTDKNDVVVLTVESFIMMSTQPSQSCQCKENRLATKVLYYQDSKPSLIPPRTLNALKRVYWKTYGLSPRSSTIDVDGDAVLEWEDIPSPPRVYIAINSYRNRSLQPQSKASADWNFVKKAVTAALDDLKSKHTGSFLSSNAKKILECVPELSRSIAGLVVSSRDPAFRMECAALMGLHPSEAGLKERVAASVQEKILSIIETNEATGNRTVGPSLFECGTGHEEERVGEVVAGEEEEEDEDQMLLDSHAYW